MNRFMRPPSPGLVVALLALFVALGSSGYAATQSQSSGKAEQSVKVKRGPRGFHGSRGLRGLKGAPGAEGAAGAAGAAGAPGSALAFAHVETGVLDAANSKNVTVTLANATTTCLNVSSAQPPRSVVAMIDNSGANPATTSVAGTVKASTVASICPAGSNAEITTAESGLFVSKPFYVVFN
jgi:hypothetical protein